MRPMMANTILQGIGVLETDTEITDIVTDSRKIINGCIFVCIKGERADGHDFAKAALASGAALVLAQHSIQDIPTEKCVVVGDIHDALIQIGANYRAAFSPVLVGVTGSVGKTTTKEFCYAVFSAFGKTLKTQGNQNNEIGMPKTLLRLDESVEYAVIEMGMQGLGEIRKLTNAAKPQGAIITCIGRSHLEQLGTRENILKAKLEICEGLSEGAPLVINIHDDFLPKADLRPDLRRVTFGICSDADVWAKDITYINGSSRFMLCDKENGKFHVEIPALGEHNVLNALSAYALATRLGLNAEKAAKALSNFVTTGHRQHIVQKNGITVIEDCYNANPDSMHAALKTLRDFPCERRIAVLGDMFELGELSRYAHEDIGRAAAECDVDFLITIGEETRYTHERAVGFGLSATHCADKKDAVLLLANYCKAGDAVLVKASNGMHFEDILSEFYKKIDL
ncbi:MAG: UDP-N-acetylmuramoyl-tripeptide--D-alanyl-D-alanine ligase [Oscillospiraceae bacterium]